MKPQGAKMFESSQAPARFRQSVPMFNYGYLYIACTHVELDQPDDDAEGYRNFGTFTPTNRQGVLENFAFPD